MPNSIRPILHFLIEWEPLEHEDIDLIFAVSASSTDAKETLELMKDTIQSIVARRGAVNIHYNVISYGAQTRTIVNFQDTFPNEEQLIEKLESLSSVTGTPDLDLALEDAKEAFEGPGARSQARKILVFLVDSKSGSTDEDILKSAVSLEEVGVQVIVLAIGNEVKREELEKTTPYKKNVMEVSNKEDPESLAKKLTNKIRESKYSFVLKLTLLLLLTG